MSAFTMVFKSAKNDLLPFYERKMFGSAIPVFPEDFEGIR